jgi:hypothetical protein
LKKRKPTKEKRRRQEVLGTTDVAQQISERPITVQYGNKE